MNNGRKQVVIDTCREDGTIATILIVDDVAEKRELLIRTLAKKGHTLLEAADGIEALAVVRELKPDLVITDLIMPKMNGYQFLQTLRTEPEIAHTPTIFYTATYSQEKMVTLARLSGIPYVIPLLAKPADIERIVEDALVWAHVAIPMEPPSSSQELAEIIAELKSYVPKSPN